MCSKHTETGAFGFACSNNAASGTHYNSVAHPVIVLTVIYKSTYSSVFRPSLASRCLVLDYECLFFFFNPSTISISSCSFPTTQSRACSLTGPTGKVHCLTLHLLRSFSFLLLCESVPFLRFLSFPFLAPAVSRARLLNHFLA